MAKNIIGSYWFTTVHGTIGVVARRRLDGRWRAYIGICLGKDKEFDSKIISDLGSPIPEKFAQALFPEIEGEYVNA